MLPLNREKLHARNAELYAVSGRGAIEARLEEWEKKNPSVTCQACSGKGNFTVHRDGVKDHSIPSAAAGDVVEPCGACRGWGFVRVSPSTKAWLERQAVRQKRAAYRKIARAVRADRGLSAEDFNRLVTKRLKGVPSPDAYLAAAKDLARFFGVEA